MLASFGGEEVGGVEERARRAHETKLRAQCPRVKCPRREWRPALHRLWRRAVLSGVSSYIGFVIGVVAVVLVIVGTIAVSFLL